MLTVLAVAAGLDATFWLEAALFLLLVALSGVFSGSEVAFLTLSRPRRQRLAREGAPGAKALEELLRHPQRFLITILVANNVVNIGAASLAAGLAIDAFGDAGIALATGVTTFLVLTFGEITPKAYATLNNERFALRAARPVLVLQKALWPVVRAYEAFTMRLLRAFGAKDPAEAARQFANEEELLALMTVAVEEGVIEEREEEMLHSVVELGDTVAREVMVPRIDVLAVPADATLADVRARAVDSGYSRIPVYERNLDNVVGVLYVRDLLTRLVDGEGDLPARHVMREALFVPETQPVSVLLSTMRERRMHLAVVVDEFGGTAGIVTMEDVLEEIVGDIFDEYDIRQERVRRLEDGSAVVDARLRVDEVNDALDTALPEDGPYDSIGGLVFHRLGRLGQEGETVREGDVDLVLDRVTSRRIARVRVVPRAAEHEAAAGEARHSRA